MGRMPITARAVRMEAPGRSIVMFPMIEVAAPDFKNCMLSRILISNC